MKSLGLVAVALSLVAAPALALDAPAIRSGATIVTADGKRVGQVDGVTTDKSGAQWASVIMDSRFVHIPAATLTAGEKKRLVTSLTFAEVRGLK